MKKGVIYARYSSDRQNEQSIAGQIDVCSEWAKNNDINIVNIYHDEALSGKTDNRPDFQRMIRDAKGAGFDYIIVYKLDRFARNRYDSAIYKAQLKKHGVRIISAMENIADGPEGIILESVLEGMAEYYSANLSQNVLRGMRQRAELGKYVGGTVPLGYKIDKDKNYIIDEDTACIVRRIYDMYAEGHTVNEICKDLNQSGYKSSTGKSFTYHSLNRILTNAKYVGRYECMGITVENATPRIVDDETFDKVQQRVERNRRAPASAKSDETFYLTGKLFCGKCRSSMVGDSGTSSTGATHYYYSCIEKKRKHGCKKKSVKKDFIERAIVDVTVNQVLTDENIEKLSKEAYAVYKKDREDVSEITALEQALKETQKTIDNIMKAIEQGIITETTKQRMMEAEERKNNLLISIEKEKIAKPELRERDIKFFLYDVKNKVYNEEEKIETIINTFINAVYLFDDEMIITYNFREGEKLKKLRISDLEKFGFNNRRCTTSEQAMYRLLRFFMQKSEFAHAAAPPLSQKITFASAIRLQARS